MVWFAGHQEMQISGRPIFQMTNNFLWPETVGLWRLLVHLLHSSYCISKASPSRHSFYLLVQIWAAQVFSCRISGQTLLLSTDSRTVTTAVKRGFGSRHERNGFNAVPSTKRAAAVEQYGERAEGELKDEGDGWFATPYTPGMSHAAEDIPSTDCGEPSESKELQVEHSSSGEIPDIDDLVLEDMDNEVCNTEFPASSPC